MKYFPLGFEPQVHGLLVELSTTELFDLLMGGHEINVYIKYRCICLHISRQYAHVPKLLIVNKVKQNVLNSSKFNIRHIDTTDTFCLKCDKNVAL